MIKYLNQQGTDEWLGARRGVLTASNFRIARSKKKNGSLTGVALRLAMNIAREQLGGKVNQIHQTKAMKIGQEEEDYAIAAYENQNFVFHEKTGLITTDDRLYGCSPDALINDNGGLEVKTMVASATLFKHWVNSDIAEFRDQCMGALWLLKRQWWDVLLWAPDMTEPLRVVRIERDESEIEALADDLDNFYNVVDELKKQIDPDSIPRHNGHELIENIEIEKMES